MRLESAKSIFSIIPKYNILINCIVFYDRHTESSSGELRRGNEGDVGSKTKPLLSDSEIWRHKKKHMMTAIKQLCNAHIQLEPLLLRIGVKMIEEIDKYDGNDFSPNDLFCTTIMSSIMTFAYGYSTQESLKRLNDIMFRTAELLSPSGLNILLDICAPL